MSCPNCGSWAVKADRSLAGRMICGRCGQPLGGQVLPLKPRRSRSGARPGGIRSGRWIWWLALGTLLGVSGVLAVLDPVRQTPQPRPLQSLPGGKLF